MQTLIDYILHLADNSFIYGHRLGEWCGHGPALETDMALTNMALDSVGAARSLYAYAAQLEGQGKTEDTYPYFRDVRAFRNVLLTELPNGNFADTIARSFYFDTYQFHFYTALQQSSNEQLAAIAAKSLKEVTYHLRFSREWVIRLGDGTEESKHKMQDAIHALWEYTGELFDASATEKQMQQEGIAPDIALLKPLWEKTVAETLEEATLSYPLQLEGGWFQQGGKTGRHTEHLGYILAEVQYMQKSYPGCEW
ncbi:MAG TPA: phenylacetate-CoA oxygenase subunit PaaC [Chitinophagaceae bacterium]|nr:phenylacetate-CoA oxygenase subunit PaaC [Chitinophagaceae bacterium]HNF71602.1 phenylacetate-CoA oxygenase subunit PaaC [Chitinophagaceae bacterium]